MRSFVFPMALGALFFAAAPAQANPHELPFSYPTESLPHGAMEIEQYVDLTPTRTYDTTGKRAWTLGSVLTTEYEYGITDRLELGLYLQLSNDTGSGTGVVPLGLDGIKQRLRYRFAAPGAWPIDVAVYGEVAELSNEIELEAKLNLERRFGRVGLLTNLWAEHEFYYNGVDEWVLNPTAGVTVELHPVVHVGAEFWMHAELGQNPIDPLTRFNADPHYYAGPTVLLQFGRLWWSTGAYLRFDGLQDSTMVGSRYGHVWVRTMIGVEL